MPASAAQHGRRAPVARRSRALLLVWYAVTWIALEVATQGISGPLATSLWYPPTGLSAALLLFGGLRFAPAVALTSLVHAALFRGGGGPSAAAVIGYAVAYTGLWVAGCAVYTRMVRVDPRLVRMRDVGWFVSLLCLATPLAVLLVTVALQVAMGEVGRGEFLANVLVGWAGEATGVAIGVPLAAVLLRSGWPSGAAGSRSPVALLRSALPPRRDLPELALQVLLLVATVVLAFGTARGVQLDSAWLVFVPLVWVAVRHGLPRSTAFVVAYNVGAVVLMAGGELAENAVLLQFGLVVTSLVTLLLAGSVDDRRRVGAAVAESERRFRSLVQNSSEVIKIVDVDGTLRYASPAFTRVFGHDVDASLGRNVLDWVHPDDVPTVLAETQGSVARGAWSTSRLQYRFRCADGSYRTVESVATYLLDDPAVDGVVVNVRDVTERRGLEERLTHQAFHDPLTGLPNRTLLLDRLEQALARVDGQRVRGAAVTLAVLFLDLDDFKAVNDSLGHEAGDQLLVTAAGRLVGVLRPQDTVGRLGGDEFCVLLEVSSVDDAAVAASRALAALSEETVVLTTPDGRSDEEVHLTASLGLALAHDGTEPSDLLRQADLAMYRAKAEGGGRFSFFERGLADAVAERVTLRRELLRGLERGEFVLQYQPQVAVDGGEVRGLEALLRWHHPDRGVVMPGDFIPAAEETGVIVPIGRWVLEEALTQVARWRADGVEVPRMSVNLSVRQLRQDGLVQGVAALLERAGVPAAHLTLEVTESVLMEDLRARRELRSLAALGLGVAIDDFGTGYSSLAYLRSFPAGSLKIDSTFVRDLVGDTRGAAMVKAMVTLGHAVGMTVVAEGAETQAQLRALAAMGCDTVQGHVVSRPLSVHDVPPFLALAPAPGRGRGRPEV